MQYQPRSCPRCGAREWSLLLEVTGRELFRSNWSYRPQALEALGAEADRPLPIGACTSCGFVFATLLPSPASLAFVYDNVIDAGKARAANLSPHNIAAKMRFVATSLALAGQGEPRLNVLDYGCGFGPTLEVLSGLTCVEAIGFETSAARLHDLAQRGLHATADAAAVCSRGPFALAILDNVLEHVPDPIATVQFVRSACAPGAIVFVSVPERSAADLRSLHGRTADALPMDINPWEHLNYFDLPQLDAVLAQAGLTPLAAHELPAPVDIGLRPMAPGAPRATNAAASTLRMLRYAVGGEVLASATARFYRAP